MKTKKAAPKQDAKKSVNTKTGQKALDKGKSEALKKANAAIPRDRFGFREGSNVSKLFAALIKGAVMEDLKKITGSATSKTLSEFKAKLGDGPRNRGAIIEKNEKTGILKITDYKLQAAE